VLPGTVAIYHWHRPKAKNGTYGFFVHITFCAVKIRDISGLACPELSRSGHRTQHPNLGLSRKIWDSWQPYHDLKHSTLSLFLSFLVGGPILSRKLHIRLASLW